MKTLLKTVCSFVLVSAASATMLFALPHGKHARNSNAKPHGTSGGSITLDSSFNAPFFATPDTSSRAVPLPDGKYVIFFNTDTLADQSTGSLVRFNPDGSLDTSFSFSPDLGGVSAVAPWFDLPPEGIRGKSSGTLIVATQQPIYGVDYPAQHKINNVLRLNSDGSVDPSFSPATGAVFAKRPEF